MRARVDGHDDDYDRGRDQKDWYPDDKQIGEPRRPAVDREAPSKKGACKGVADCCRRGVVHRQHVRRPRPADVALSFGFVERKHRHALMLSRLGADGASGWTR